MTSEFPYQIVAFFDRTPSHGELVYGGEHEWYAQIALKRRFRTEGIDEAQLIDRLTDYFRGVEPFIVRLGDLTQPERMPVRVIAVDQDDALMALHSGIIEILGDNIVSRFPERDGENYYPHVTAEYDGKFVIDVEHYRQSTYTIASVWLLKDTEDWNSSAHHQFDLKSL